MLDRMSCPRWRRKRGYAMGDTLQMYRTGWSFSDADGCRSALGIGEGDASMWEMIDRSEKLSKVDTVASNVLPRQFGEFTEEARRHRCADDVGTFDDGVDLAGMAVEEEEEHEVETLEEAEMECEESGGVENSAAAWGDLPDDLQIGILAYVPFTKLLQARSVCKAWNSLILSPEFGKIHVDKPGAVCKSYFPMFLQKKGKRQVVAYEFGAQKWRRLPFFSFLPSDVNHMNRRRRQTLFPIFGAGGLLCCTKEAPDGGCVLTVFNPLTRSWKELPLVAAKLSSDDCFHMVAQDEQDGAKSFQIVAAQGDRSKEIYVYSSISNSWLVIPLPVRCQGWSFLGRTTICNGMIYCVIGAADIIAYDLQQRVWIDVLDTLPDGFFLLKRLIACDGQLFCVAVRRHFEFHSFVLRLKLDTLEWVVASQFPNDLHGYPANLHCRELSPNAQCVAHQGRLCFTDRIAERWIMLVYDISKQAWSLLPSCPYFNNTESGEYQVVSSAFQPNFGVTLS